MNYFELQGKRGDIWRYNSSEIRISMFSPYQAKKVGEMLGVIVDTKGAVAGDEFWVQIKMPEKALLKRVCRSLKISMADLKRVVLDPAKIEMRAKLSKTGSEFQS